MNGSLMRLSGAAAALMAVGFVASMSLARSPNEGAQVLGTPLAAPLADASVLVTIIARNSLVALVILMGIEVYVTPRCAEMVR